MGTRFHTISRCFVICKKQMFLSEHINKQILICIIIIIVIIIIWALILIL